MNTTNSPQSTSRSQKLNGGRERFAVYFPKEEADAIRKQVEKTGLSQSSIIANRYFQGKNLETSNKD